MAQITVYMNYVIFFQDESDYNSALAIAGSPIVEICPVDAAALFGIPYPPPTGAIDNIPKGMYGFGIALQAPFTELRFPNPSGVFADASLPSVLVPGQAGSPASIFPAGPDGLHVWSATLIRTRAAGAGVSPPANAISQRRWVCGFEHASDLDGSSSNAVSDFSRDSSRVLEGCGLRAGGPNNRFLTNTMLMLRAGLVTQTHWDRFYFRARVQPPAASSDIGFWRATCSLGASMGAQLIYQSTGNIKLFNINNAGTYFDKGVVLTPTLNQWYRFDVLTRSGNPGNGVVQVYINGVFALGFTDNTNEGLGTGGNLISIIFGQQFTNTNLGEIDLDDWIGADLPTNVNAATLAFNDANFPIDWLLGSHVRRLQSESASLVNWAPNSFGSLNGDINPTRFDALGITVGLASSTALAQIDGLTDAPLQSVQDRIGLCLGVASGVLTLYSRNSGASDGQLGYRLAGGAVVQVSVNQFAFNNGNFMGYLPSGMILPDEASPFSVIHTKSNNGDTDTTFALAACVEYLGVFGPEDDPVITLPMNRNLLHNCNYPNSEYGFHASLPGEPVYAAGGTYVGNGTTTTVVTPGPAHFIYIRKTTGGVDGELWFATSLGGMNPSSNDVLSNIRTGFDSLTGQYFFQVNGADTRVNQNAQTYQYIVFCDPGARFNICGVFAHPASASTPQANVIPQTGFLADFGFIQDNLIQSGGGIGNGLWFKGPGITANNAIQLNGAGNTANGFNFAAGILNTFASVHNMGNRNNWVYSLWRTADSGSGGCANVMIQATTYVGNGVSPRNIPLAPLSGRMPLFVWVQRNGGNGVFRDPSHAGANSATSSNFGTTATGITAVGVDQITVSTDINTNGQTYTVWAICGDVAGMNNGVYYPTYCVPPGGTPPTPPQGDIIVVGNGGIILNGTTSLLMLQDVGGIYTLVPGKLNDTLQDTQTGQPSVDVPILPIAKTGYIGG